jgi:hypothetical protein
VGGSRSRLDYQRVPGAISQAIHRSRLLDVCRYRCFSAGIGSVAGAGVHVQDDRDATYAEAATTTSKHIHGQGTMSLEKAIEHGKEHRKQYHDVKAVDRTCRNHGSCLWCARGRLHKRRIAELSTQEAIREAL